MIIASVRWALRRHPRLAHRLRFVLRAWPGHGGIVLARLHEGGIGAARGRGDRAMVSRPAHVAKVARALGVEPRVGALLDRYAALWHRWGRVRPYRRAKLARIVATLAEALRAAGPRGREAAVVGGSRGLAALAPFTDNAQSLAGDALLALLPIGLRAAAVGTFTRAAECAGADALLAYLRARPLSFARFLAAPEALAFAAWAIEWARVPEWRQRAAMRRRRTREYKRSGLTPSRARARANPQARKGDFQ